MKKLVLSLILCFGAMQSAHTATSSLVESVLEYEAILSAVSSNPTFENVIASSEFITDIVRKTSKVDITGTVKYKITTRVPAIVQANDSNTKHKHKSHERVNSSFIDNICDIHGHVGANIIDGNWGER